MSKWNILFPKESSTSMCTALAYYAPFAIPTSNFSPFVLPLFRLIEELRKHTRRLAGLIPLLRVRAMLKAGR
jgi:hypothetical protein